MVKVARSREKEVNRMKLNAFRWIARVINSKLEMQLQESESRFQASEASRKLFEAAFQASEVRCKVFEADLIAERNPPLWKNKGFLTPIQIAFFGTLVVGIPSLVFPSFVKIAELLATGTTASYVFIAFCIPIVLLFGGIVLGGVEGKSKTDNLSRKLIKAAREISDFSIGVMGYAIGIVLLAITSSAFDQMFGIWSIISPITVYAIGVSEIITLVCFATTLSNLKNTEEKKFLAKSTTALVIAGLGLCATLYLIFQL
jgi:hypothetical protein